MSDKRTCHVCGKTFDGYGLRLWCSVGCESNYFEIASLESRLQTMTERAEEAERALVASREAIKTYCADANDMASEAVEFEKERNDARADAARYRAALEQIAKMTHDFDQLDDYRWSEVEAVARAALSPAKPGATLVESGSLVVEEPAGEDWSLGVATITEEEP